MATLKEKTEKLYQMSVAKFTPEQVAMLDAAKQELDQFVEDYGLFAIIAMTLKASEGLSDAAE